MDLDEVESERLDVGQYAVERRLIQEAGEYGLGALPLRSHSGERRQHRGAEVAVDPDRVLRGRGVHDAMLIGGQVNLHHQDLVTAVLPGEARGQEP